MSEPILSAEMLAIIRRDDERMPNSVKLADRSRVLWDRHCLLAEVDRLRTQVEAITDAWRSGNLNQLSDAIGDGAPPEESADV